MHGDVNKSDVGNCSSCDECSVQIKESTPLLAQNVRSTVNCCVLFLLLLTFAAGTTIGIYLLVEEIRWEPNQSSALIVGIDLRNKSKLNESEHRMHKIQLTEVSGHHCDNNGRCLTRIDQFPSMNFNETDNTNEFNFLVDAGAIVYEHYGFDKHCPNCDNDVLQIALSRNLTEDISSHDSQKYKVEEIISYGVTNKKLMPCCVISVTKDIDWLRILANNIRNDISQKYNCTS
ncbi:hypothetical protein QE152_g31442 [Popillia japonica]|uniref:Uncharacterized protein n=1 Tax=Popillia japonica TaxID=7064 RepID=A0AAW1J1K0_POPJA